MTTTAELVNDDPDGPLARRSDTGVVPWWIGAIVGLVAAVSGLAVAEFVTGFGADLRSPIVGVGDRVVDSAPRALKTWAIDTFGTSDKAVLLTVVAVLLAGFAAGIGMVTIRRGLRAGLIGIGVFTAIGAAASLGRGSGGATSVLPSIVGGVAAGAVLVVLVRKVGVDLSLRSAPPAAGTAPSTVGEADGRVPLVANIAERTARDRRLAESDALRRSATSRRQFLGMSAAFVAGAAVVGGAGRWLQQRGVAAAERVKVMLPTARTPLPPVPAGADLGVAGAQPFITPIKDFYRIDTALTVPQVDPRTWTMKVGGRVQRPLSFTYEELLDRPMVEADITLSCVSNEIGGDLVGNARWLGCRLDELLDEAGIEPGADQIVGRSVDGFTAGFPTALLDGRDALVAVGMNGEPLPIVNGFPARLVVPGVYGYVSATKWLSEIELTSFADFEGYWIPRGWSTYGPIKTQSRIDTPAFSASLPRGRVPVAGVAWAPTRGISKVEVSVDNGEWHTAELGEQYVDTTWRQWKWVWDTTDVAAGKHKLQVRATDGEGETQTEQVTRVAPNGASGWHYIRVDVD